MNRAELRQWRGLLAVIAWCFLCSSAQASNEAVSVNLATEVVQQWRPDQHLYVKGNVGVSSDLLNQLEVWLDKNGSNWTVVLLANAQGEQFVDAGGERFSGMDAVEHGLGKGLVNQTAFGQARDSRTGEPNGAWFALFLQERKFSYFGSTAQDKRGLGESAWQGNLDRPAVAAMRSGGRVVDAVKDTVENINRRLGDKITAEIRTHQQRAAARKAQEEALHKAAAQALADAANALDSLKTAVQDLRAEYPNLPTDVDWLDASPLDSQISRAHALRQSGDATQAHAEATRALQTARTTLGRIEEYRAAPPEMDQLAELLARQADRPYGSTAETPRQEARDSLREARAAHGRGDLSYRNQLHSAHVTAKATERLIEQAARNARLVRQLGIALATGTVFCLCLLGGVLVLRRRGVKEQSETLCETWKTTLQKQTSPLIDLLDRTSLAVGSSRIEAQKRWTGKTLESAEELIRDVDELFIMSGCTGRILEDAQRILKPTGFNVIKNLLTKRPYLAVIRMLRDEPIVFRPEEALERAVHRDTKLLGDSTDCKPFKMSFNDLIATFSQRTDRAKAMLDQLEAGITRLPGLLDTLQKDLTAARATEQELAKAAEQDGGFQVPPLAEQLLPQNQADLDQAARMSAQDPIGALEGPAAQAERRIRDTRALAEALSNAREQILPRLKSHREQLSGSGLAVDWLHTALNNISADADQIAERTLKTETNHESARLSDDLRQLLECAATICKADQRRIEVVLPAMEETRHKITVSRQAIGQSLKIDPAGVLHEKNTDPDEIIAAAEEQLLALKAGSDRGDVEAVEAALAETVELNTRANGVVDATQAAFEEHAGLMQGGRRENDRLRALRPQHESIIGEMRTRFLPTALVLGSGDPTHPRANGTVEDNLTEIDQLLKEAETHLQRAELRFAEGGILEAATLLEQTTGCHSLAVHRFEEITEKSDRLQKTVELNRQRLDQLSIRTQQARTNLADHRVMRPTQQAFEQLEEQIARSRTSIEADVTDPFADATQLATAEEGMARLDQFMLADRELHAEAQRSLQAAQTQLAEAERWASQSEADRHADSAALLRTRKEVHELRHALEAAGGNLQVRHGDWAQVDEEADRLSGEAARCAASIRGEIRAAEEAAAALQSAGEAVRSTAGWIGALGVSILGRPGHSEFEQARGALLRGDYSSGRRFAELAARIALQELARARAEEARRRRAAEEARERQRRQRRQAEQAAARRRSTTFSSIGSSIGRSIGSSSRGGFSMGSGSARSGFSSRSGASRSGW